MRALPSRLIQDTEVIIYQDRSLMCFFSGGCILKVPPVGIDECKPSRLLALPFHEGEQTLKECKVFLPWQCGYALLGIIIPLFVEVVGIEDD